MGGLLVLTLFAALIAPFFIDWTAYRADFEREASRILGREVTVRGAASARLLPFPTVTFENVAVAGTDEGAPFLTVDRFRMNAELAPYLSGEIRIFSMALERPVVTLGMTDDGRPRLPTLVFDVPENATVVLENVAITDGAMLLTNAEGTETRRLADIDGQFSAESLQGPIEGTATATLDGEALEISLATGSAGDDGLPLRIAATSRSRSAEISFDGRVVADEGRMTGLLDYRQPLPEPIVVPDGSDVFAAMSDDDADLRGSLAPDAPSKPPLRATATATIASDAVELADIRVAVGPQAEPYTLTGTGEFAIGAEPRFHVKLEGEAFDVDRLPARDDPSSDDGATVEAVSLPERLEAVRQVLADIPRPAIEGTIDLLLPVVTVQDTTISNLGFEASPDPRGWRVRNLTAELPGRTRLEADGVIGLAKSLSFRGDLLVASSQPSGFSDWLTGAVDPSIRTLSAAGLKASVDLDADRQAFRNLTLDIGGDAITGSLERVKQPSGARLTARLKGGTVDLDVLSALTRVVTGGEDALGAVSRFDVALDAGPITAGSVTADHVDADVLYDGDTLAIAKLDIDGLAGASVQATGRLTELATDALGTIDVALEAEDPESFIAFLDAQRPDTPVLQALRTRGSALGPLTLSGEIQSIERGQGRPTLLLRFDGEAGATKIDLSSAVENGFAAARESGRVGIDLRLESDQPASLLSQLGLPASGSAIPGPLELEASLSASAIGPAVLSASLRGGGTDASFEGVLNLAEDGLTSVDSSVYVESQSVVPWLDTLGVDLGQSGFTQETIGADLTAQVVYDDEGIHVRELSGALGGSGIQLDLDYANDGTLKGSLRSDVVSLPWLARLTYGVPVYDAAQQDWTTTPFAASLLPSTPLDLDIRVDRLDAGPARIANAAFRLTGRSDEVALDLREGEIGGGSLTGQLTMRNYAGLGGMSADLRADELALAELAPALSGGPQSDLTLTARLDSTAQSAAGLIAGLSGAGHLTAVVVSIPGIPADPLDQILTVADGEEFSADSDTGATLDDVSRNAGFAISRFDADYAVTAGRAVLTPTTVSSAGADLTIAAALDLTDMRVESAFDLAIDPGEAAIAGTEPAVRYRFEGPLLDPTRTRDPAALANFLSVRALEREQARVEAMQERLSETLRLRREARFYRWLQEDEARRLAAEAEARAAEERARQRAIAEEAAAREAAEQAAAAEQRAAEEAAAEAAAEEAERRRENAEAEAEAAAASRAERQRRAEASEGRAAESAGEAAGQPGDSTAPGPDATAPLDFDNPVPETSDQPAAEYDSLPGVGDPLRF